MVGAIVLIRLSRRTTPDAVSRPLTIVALLVGFTAAVLVRVAVGGRAVAGSASAGLVFAGCLAALTVAARAGIGPALSRRAVLLGLAGAAVLCLPSARGARPATPGYARAAATCTGRWSSPSSRSPRRRSCAARSTPPYATGGATPPPCVVTAIAFAALHLPLYGWGSVPLDLAVGLVLGVLREQTGGWAAPAICHVGADLAAWWLR